MAVHTFEAAQFIEHSLATVGHALLLGLKCAQAIMKILLRIVRQLH
jgi:hypothetical protein